MSISTTNATTSNNLTLSATAAGAIQTGPYTVAVLYKRTTTGFSNSAIWKAYQPDDFGYRGVVVDADDLFSAPDGGSYDANLLRDDATWYWIAVSKAAGVEQVRFHIATYTSSGALTWVHQDGDPLGGAAQGDKAATIDRLCFGDPFGSGFSGHLAAIAAWTSELPDATIETALTQAAQAIYDAAPQVLVLAPEVQAASPLVDQMGGAGETARSTGWTASADPSDFDFTVTAGGGGGDTTPPSIPDGLAASNITETSFVLTFNPATDNVAVAGYQMTLDGGATTSTATSGMTVSGLSGSSTYDVRVRAYDAAGNASGWSIPLPVTTLPGTPTGGTASLLVRASGQWIQIV